MSDHHSGALKGHRPIHAFYLPPPANFVLSSTVSASEKETFATPTPTTAPFRIYTAIPTPFYHPAHPNSHSMMISMSSNSANPSISPFVIAKSPPPLNTSSPHNDNTTTSMVENPSESKDLPWIAPLLGVLGTLGLIAIVAATIICCCRRRNKKEAAMRQRKRQLQQQQHEQRNTFTSSYQQRTLTNSYQSWNSFSTIRNDENKKTISHIFSPHAAAGSTDCTTTNKQKRWTADTLVEEPSLAMLKKQYSPQLAFSPSLVAGELQQQQHLVALPENAAFNHLSPSNTLIDNAGVLSSTIDLDKKKSYFHHLEHNNNNGHRPRIEMYDPQVNLQDENPFEAPYPYCNDQKEQTHCIISEEKETYQAIDINESHHH
jgi:hypothetical protein